MQTKNSTKSRTHDEFMADQMRFEQNRFEKLKHVISLEEEEVSGYFKPALSKGSKKILEKKQGELSPAPNSTSVHHRLYSAK